MIIDLRFELLEGSIEKLTEENSQILDTEISIQELIDNTTGHYYKIGEEVNDVGTLKKHLRDAIFQDL